MATADGTDGANPCRPSRERPGKQPGPASVGTKNVLNILSQLGLSRRQHHHHLAAFELRFLLHFGDLGGVVLDALQ